MVAYVVFVILTDYSLGADTPLAVFGFSVSLIFILFSASDLGITEILVETLTVILLDLVLFKLPGYSHYSKGYQVWRVSTVAVLFGLLVTLLMLWAFDVRYFESI